tara:strand:+ start:30688 stop:30864 length:177 start_codon:yes stop_codon:yes gene_type:complete
MTDAMIRWSRTIMYREEPFDAIYTLKLNETKRIYLRYEARDIVNDFITRMIKGEKNEI